MNTLEDNEQRAFAQLSDSQFRKFTITLMDLVNVGLVIILC